MNYLLVLFLDEESHNCSCGVNISHNRQVLFGGRIIFLSSIWMKHLIMVLVFAHSLVFEFRSASSLYQNTSRPWVRLESWPFLSTNLCYNNFFVIWALCHGWGPLNNVGLSLICEDGCHGQLYHPTLAIETFRSNFRAHPTFTYPACCQEMTNEWMETNSVFILYNIYDINLLPL